MSQFNEAFNYLTKNQQQESTALKILLVCVFLVFVTAISVIAIAVYASVNEPKLKDECYASLPEDYECIAFYVQVPKPGVNE